MTDGNTKTTKGVKREPGATPTKSLEMGENIHGVKTSLLGDNLLASSVQISSAAVGILDAVDDMVNLLAKVELLLWVRNQQKDCCSNMLGVEVSSNKSFCTTLLNALRLSLLRVFQTKNNSLRL